MATGARRALINTLIWSLIVAAFFAIVAVASGSDNDVTGRILGTFLALALYSTTSLAGAGALARPSACALAPVTWAVSAAGLATALIWIWDGADDDGLAKLAGITAVAAASVAHAAVLVLRRRREDRAGIRAGEGLALIAVGLLAGLAVNAIATETDDNGYLRAMGVVAILDAYGTLAIPLMRPAGKSVAASSRVLLVLLTFAAAAGITGLITNAVDEDMVRLLVTLPFAAICCATAFAGVVVRRLPRHDLLGDATIAASGAAFIAALNLIWISDFNFDGDGMGALDWAWGLLVLAATLAHIAVLIARQRPRDSPATRTLVRWAIAAAAVAGFTFVYPVLDDTGNSYGPWLSVVLILDVLGTMLVALVRKRDVTNGAPTRLRS